MTTRKEINPLVLKFGVALAVSFAGYLYSRLRPKCHRPSLPPPPSSPPDADRQISCRAEREDDFYKPPRIPSRRGMNLNSESQAKPFLRVKVDDNGSSESSPSTSHNGGRNRVLSPELNDTVEHYNAVPIVTPPRTKPFDRDEYEQEITSLCSTVNELRQREELLQRQLLEYRALEKDHERALMELQNRLKIKNVEHKIFTLKIQSLESENRRLEAQLVDYPTAVAELDAAKAKIKELMRDLRSEAEHNREQMLKLKERVQLLKLQEQGSSSEISQHDMLSKLQRLQDLEGERDELRKSRRELQRENSELDKRLESAQNLATTMLGDPQVGGRLQHEAARLMAENERLAMEVERLQLNRCADAEELVYLRWINACLRFELRNYQPPPGKTIARDLSKSLSPKSEAKAKQLILEYAYTTEEKGVSVVDFEYDQWSSSLSNPTDPGDQDDVQWVDATSASNANHSKGLKLFDRLRRLLKGKKHSKTKNLAMSRSVEDLRRTYTRESSTRAPSVSPRGKEVMGMKRSLSASSSRGYKRFVLGRESGGSVSPLESQPEETPELSFRKTDLVRYAEVLKESSWSRRKHRKSASVL